MANIENKISAHYISGTHWDREWYRPFEEYRFMLVQLVDSLLDLMEKDGAFRYFQFDGQTCMLEDYLEIRPENRERLGKLIKEGRILIGPWYTMPDLFCPDGESLVRNLLMGSGISREWGVSPMPVGFICDMFGHPSQMPQIFAGFGIKDVVLGRGTNESTTEMFFDWVGSDGTKNLTYKLQDSLGYGGFAGPRAVFEEGFIEALRQIEGYKEFTKALEEAGSDEERKSVLEKWGGNELARYVNHEIQRANLPALAVMDTMDHTIPATDVDHYLRLIRESLPELEPRHSTLPDFFEDVRSQLADTKLLVKYGELREPSKERCDYLHLIPNCVSARIPLKIVGDRAAALLQRWTDPLVALAQQESNEVQSWRPFLNRAWKQLLLNHAHDSVCGCSIDQVHRDMLSRFEQVQVLGEQLRQQALAVLTSEAAELAENKDEFTLMIFNPLPHVRHEAVEFDIDFPTDYPTTFHEGFRSQNVLGFTLEDSEGNVIPYQRLHVSPNMNERSKLARYCHVSDGQFHRYRVAATIALPACGYTSLRVKPAKRPVRNMETMRTGPATAENEFLAVEIADNGTLTLTDKQNAQTYRDLLIYEDRSELGDGWYHGHSVNDMVRLSKSSQVAVAVHHDGPEMVTFRVEIKLEVPRRYDWHREEPSSEKGSITISTDVSLRRHAQVVDVTTTIDNQAEDHQLQLLLPSDVQSANSYFAQTAFDVVERKIALDTNTHNWQEAEITEKPFESFQAIGQGERGLAFLSAGGLHEGGVRNDKRRTMQVTLLRSFRRTFGTEGETDGLELGKTQYRYALMPFKGPVPRKALVNHALELQSSLLTRQTGARPSGHGSLKKDGVAAKSFLEIKGDMVISSIKLAEGDDGTTVVRLWNPSEGAAKATLAFERSVKAVEFVGLDEERLPEIEPPEMRDGKIVIISSAKQMVTLKVSFG